MLTLFTTLISDVKNHIIFIKTLIANVFVCTQLVPPTVIAVRTTPPYHRPSVARVALDMDLPVTTLHAQVQRR